MGLHNLGTLDLSLSRTGRGRAHFESSLEILREVGDTFTAALCLAGLAQSLVRLGELEAARERIRECFGLMEQLATPREAVSALESLAEWLLATGHAPEAARVMTGADSARRALRMSLMPVEKSVHEELRRLVRERVESSELERIRAAGQELTLKESLAQARPLLDLPL